MVTTKEREQPPSAIKAYLERGGSFSDLPTDRLISILEEATEELGIRTERLNLTLRESWMGDSALIALRLNLKYDEDFTAALKIFRSVLEQQGEYNGRFFTSLFEGEYRRCCRNGQNSTPK
jgi:hypothetical protein